MIRDIKTENLSFQWLTQDTNVSELISLFINNSDTNYISHGEIQEGRALNENKWSTNIESQLQDEFQAALKNEIFEDANLAGAYYRDNLIGFLFLQYTTIPNETYATLSDIIVDKSFRNNNIGEKLLTWVFKHLKENNIYTLFAESNKNNQVAHNFLHKNGFKEISKVFINHL